ncbi:MAG TPA: hypothetical protein VMJ74_05905, partial [Pseudomonadales bacterium]|nr:hypothetical protein [Pseudomonadales bacterium]
SGAVAGDLSRQRSRAVHFCDPRGPWQRGSNENADGLLLQYFPKRTEIAHDTQAELDAVAAQLNGRPRQAHVFKTPSQALDEVVRRPLNSQQLPRAV